jgi:hypothetical protein
MAGVATSNCHSASCPTGHSARVWELCCSLPTAPGLPQQRTCSLSAFGAFHSISFLARRAAIPASSAGAPGQLVSAEWTWGRPAELLASYCVARFSISDKLTRLN